MVLRVPSVKALRLPPRRPVHSSVVAYFTHYSAMVGFTDDALEGAFTVVWSAYARLMG